MLRNSETLSHPFRSFVPWVARQAFARLAVQDLDDLERCDATLVTLDAKSVNHT